MDQMVKTEYIVEYPYTKETIENWIKHPVSSWAKVLRALRLILGVAALVCGVSLSVYAVATAVRKNLYVNALIAAAIFILLGIFSLTAPKRSAKHTIKQQKRFQAADGWRIQFEFGESLHISSGNQSVVYDYTQMGKLTETKDCFFLWLDKNAVYRLPKSDFTKGDPDGFRAFIEPKLGPLRKGSSKQFIVKTVLLLFIICYLLVFAAYVVAAGMARTPAPTIEQAKKAFYGLRADNQTQIAQVETEDSVVTFSTDKSASVYAMLFKKENGAFTAVHEYRFTVPDWADSNRDCTLHHLRFSADGLLQIDDQSPAQVRFTCLPAEYDLSDYCYAANNTCIAPFYCGNTEYLLYALTEQTRG